MKYFKKSIIKNMRILSEFSFSKDFLESYSNEILKVTRLKNAGVVLKIKQKSASLYSIRFQFKEATVWVNISFMMISIPSEYDFFKSNIIDLG